MENVFEGKLKQNFGAQGKDKIWLKSLFKQASVQLHNYIEQKVTFLMMK